MSITIAPELKDLPLYQLGDLLELQGDLKDLTERNAGKLRRSIAKHGLFVPFFVWPAQDGNNYILDGHQRSKLMKADGHGALPVPCVLVHADTLQEAKEKLLVISSQYGKITQDGYDEFTFDLPDIGEMVNFDALSFEFGQAENEEPEQGDAEPQTDRAAELQEIWQTERGQLWAIGEHRLLCGDSTVRADVERVMGGERADMVFTDPPYGIDMDKGFSGAGGFDGVGKPIPRRQYSDEWDSERPSKETFDLLLSMSENGIIWGGNFFADILPKSTHWIVWDKHQTMPTFGDCELAWTSLPRKSVKKYDVEYNGLIGKENERFHPTQKPLRLFSMVIADYSDNEAVMLDPFAGSGTTLVACQNLSRRGRAIEISPAYCAVILQRMADAFPGIDIYKVS